MTISTSGAPGPRTTTIPSAIDTGATAEPVEEPVSSADVPVALPSSCTQAQLRRFIKSRPYVPMHELRRRFELNGAADDVSPIATTDGTVFVGLPMRESGFIAELLRQGEIGVELCHDPIVPIVVGVYATRPVAR
jgi:hypothetical protein